MPDPARLRRLIAAYEQRRSAGRPVDEDDILRSYPDLAEGFRRYIQRRAIAKPDGSRDDELAFRSETVLSEPPATELLAAGTRIDRYRIIEVLGSGAMGTVYKAEDERLGRAVAIKIPDVRGHNRELFLQRFEREARLAAELSHPSLCPILDFGTCDVGTSKQQPYLTMPVLPGPSLAQFVEIEGAQSPVDVVQLVCPIVEGLCEMHEHGVTHRDLKPSNVLLDRRGRPVITDFGLARRDRLSADVRLTNAAALLGSPAYCSPEQIRGDAGIGPTSDLYSLGVLMYELLTGRLPFEGSVGEVLGAVLHVSPPPPSELRPSLSPSMEALCLSLLHKDPAGRPQSAEEVLKRLADPSLISEPLPGKGWLQALRRVWATRKTSLAAGAGVLAGTLLLAAAVQHVPTPPTRLAGREVQPSTTGAPQRSALRYSEPDTAQEPTTQEQSERRPQLDTTAIGAVNPAPRPPITDSRVTDSPQVVVAETVVHETAPPLPVATPPPAALLSPSPFAWQAGAAPADDPLWDSEFVLVPNQPAERDGVERPNLFVDASSWLPATGRQDLTSWVPSPPQADWHRSPDTARLQNPQPLLDNPPRFSSLHNSTQPGRTLWYPRPLAAFEFEFELSLNEGGRADLIFLSLAASASLGQEAIRIPLTDDRRVANDFHVSGVVRREQIQIDVNQQRFAEVDVDSVRGERPQNNWHAVERSLPVSGYFGIQIHGDAAQLSQVRLQPEPAETSTEASAPRVVSRIQTSLQGPLLPLGDHEWVQTDQAMLTNLLDTSFAARLNLQDDARNHHWSARELVVAVATGKATDFTLLGIGVDDQRTRVLFCGPDFMVAAPLQGPDHSLQLLDVPHWNQVTRMFPLGRGHWLSYHQADRAVKDQIAIWQVTAEEAPQIVGLTTVPTHLDSLSATPDGSRIVYTVGGRLCELHGQLPPAALAMPAEYRQVCVQRIPWEVAWSAISPDGNRLALVVHLTNIWTAKLVIMQRGDQQWESISETPLAEVFWDQPPARTQRRFAGQTIQSHSLEWSADGSLLLGTFSRSWAAGSQPRDGSAMLWSDSGTTPLLRMPKVRIAAARLEEDSRHVMLVHNDGVARLWQLPNR